ncbi:MAG: UPF0280 family protein [Paracoccaceae bacterium]|nr:UPF0280 family protein [Paracoccaceae bacterium]
MERPSAAILPGNRLHLHHGPIDLVIGADGPDRARAYRRAEARFQTVLTELVAELDLLRAPIGCNRPTSPIARRMVAAITPFTYTFITPMAAVAGAVADEICAALSDGSDLKRAYVNNGGDIAVFLAPGHSLRAAIANAGAAGTVTLEANQPSRGLATSGWRGRSHSLGIADAVSVVAMNAAAADAAATLIANAVDLPGHPAVRRQPACDLSPDSDLGCHLVTIAVGALTDAEISTALDRGQARGQQMLQDGLIAGAVLMLAGQVRLVGQGLALGNTQIERNGNAGIQVAQAGRVG